MKTALIPVAVLVAVLGGLFVSGVPRGIRNNNPGNIRWDGRTEWQGMIGQDSDGFVIFDTPENGIRAMARILNSYRRRGVVSLSEIVRTWAPDVENDTESYIASASQRTGFAPQKVITADDYPALIEAIIHHENGAQPYSDEDIRRGVLAA